MGIYETIAIISALIIGGSVIVLALDSMGYFHKKPVKKG